MTAIKTEYLKPLKNNVFVTDLESGIRQTTSGIIIPDDNMKDHGIRPRWAQVFAVGPEVTDLTPGVWVLIEHARWTNAIELEFPTGIIKVWRVEYPKSVLVASDDDPRGTRSFIP